jgi:branched-chain amino acid transport system substrate-binding protein
VVRRLACALAALGLHASPALAADTIRIGFIVDVAGPFAALSEEMTRGFDLAIEHLGSKMGGIPVEVFKADSKNSPDVGVTEASRLMDRHQVQFVTGILLSNVFNAVGKQMADRGVFVLSGNAGTSYYSGKECHQNVFSVGFHNDSLNEATALYMNEKGVKSMVTVGLNYQAGRDQIGGATSKFKGKVLAQLWPDVQAMDFASEIAQIRSLAPEAVYLFLPGRPGIAFQRQLIQAGLDKRVRIYGGAFHSDELVYDALGEFATRAQLELGTFGWHHGWGVKDGEYPFMNPQSKRMVDDYVKKYNRRPTFFVAHNYDAVMLIDSAVRAVNGKVEDKDAVRAALRKADFKSVKGKFKFNNNQYPIQDHYIVTTVKDEKGVPVQKILGYATKDHGDSHAKDCPMRW